MAEGCDAHVVAGGVEGDEGPGRLLLLLHRNGRHGRGQEQQRRDELIIGHTGISIIILQWNTDICIRRI